MTILLVLPIVIPLGTAIFTLLAWRSRRAQRIAGVAGSFALLAAGVLLLRHVALNGILAVQLGNWPAPFGITLVADLFSAIMVVLGGLMAAAVAVYSLVAIDAARERFGYYPLLQMLMVGVCGAFLTGDLFNLYVWFEVMLMASFVLLALGGERPQIEGAMKYVTLNLVSSALFLAAVGILYGVAGTLNMADIAQKLDTSGQPGLSTTLAMLFLVAFGIKAAVFPLFFWLPASYHTPPVAVSAIFAGLLTKVGVYALVRVFTLIFVDDAGFTHTIILAIAALTMVTGVLGAVSQNEFRRVLSFHIVSQIGYMVMGLGLFTRLALAGSVFYIIHHIIVKTNLFLISGVVQRLSGSFQLRALGGLYESRPVLAALFLIPALSLAGLPPLSGFFAKLALVQAGLDERQFGVVAIALAVGFLTLLSMMKIWNEAFWKPQPAEGVRPTPVTAGLPVLMGPIVALACLTVLIGLSAGPVFELSARAADQLLDRRGYIRAVLGPERVMGGGL
jgi:multicomponent Na+:H+ antiporter subunit D